MRPFLELIDFEEAKKIIMEKTEPMEKREKIDILSAIGRVISEDVISDINIPGFARAAVDGYAVIAEDTYGANQREPRELKVIGKIFAGDTSKIRINRGECIQIATGGAIPDGADAVVMVEHTSLDDDTVRIMKPVYPGENVSSEDEDIAKGGVVLREGDVLNPAKIGVLAALGINSIDVYALPKVAVIPTGDELVPIGGKLEYGKIYDINSYTLASLLQGSADVHINEIIEDSEDKIKECIKSLKDMDYIIFSGGSSVGERDILIDIIEEEGEVFFHGIALKPGKPTIFGKIRNTLIFGMPGYPTSCLTNAYTLLLPSVKKKARMPYIEKKKEVILAEKIVSTIGRHQIYTVEVEDGKAYPVFKESGAITSMSEASGYIEIPANVEYLPAGSKILVKYF
ncbi:MAG: molybdenum cofactor biosynthesis protein [Thermoplasmata archaeon]|nr:MAG: molybdenum cofactor biosynthesis protein [Thermoplasmata archaeon]